jgi:uncharacterized membrane protein YhfC
MLYATRILNFVLMIALPVLLGLLLSRRHKTRWGLFGVGAATFIASQAVHLPLNFGLTALFEQGALPAPPEAWRLPFNAVALGLTAGLCEETARYLAYRFWIKSARTWREALMFGAGHGGIEAILLGALTGAAFVNFVALRNVDVATLPIPAEQQALAARQIADYWSAPWHAAMLGAVERVFALGFHLSAAVLVLQAVKRRNLLWLLAAISWHTATNAAAVFTLGTWGPYWAEAAVGVSALASLGVIFALKPSGEALPHPAPVASAPAPAPFPPSDPGKELQRRVDDTRFTS